ncbi:Lipopolysaccharide core heptosyltransferase RfaQ [bacterium HR26]|nr:Lipopolysaccharide core heptosyltransferase RfaQ [bacterium HR26]
MRTHSIPARSLRRIAILRALHLGDLLLAVPAFRSIRSGFPEAEITLIGLPWAATFARRFAHYLDRFVEFAGYPGIPEVEVDAARTARFLAEQRAYRYGLVIQMHGSGEASNPCALALGGRITAGYYVGNPPPGLDLAFPYPSDQPEILRNLGLARLLGCPDCGTALEFPLDENDRAEAAQLIEPFQQPGQLCIGLHVGARAPARRWPAERFAAVGDALADRFGALIVLTGSWSELPLVEAVARMMACRPLVAAGKTSLGGLAALIARLDLFISNDTGPAHLAVAANTPSITIFGPADHLRWAPLDRERHRMIRQMVPCSPCAHWTCPIDHRCLRAIQPEQVIELAAHLLMMGARACGT